VDEIDVSDSGLPEGEESVYVFIEPSLVIQIWYYDETELSFQRFCQALYLISPNQSMWLCTPMRVRSQVTWRSVRRMLFW